MDVLCSCSSDGDANISDDTNNVMAQPPTVASLPPSTGASADVPPSTSTHVDVPCSSSGDGDANISGETNNVMAQPPTIASLPPSTVASADAPPSSGTQDEGDGSVGSRLGVVLEWIFLC